MKNTLEKLIDIIGAEKVIEQLLEKISTLETDNFLLEIDKKDLQEENAKLKEFLTPTAKGEFDNE